MMFSWAEARTVFKRMIGYCFLASTLMSCATAYVAYEGTDAATVRVSHNGAINRSFVNISLMDENGQCGSWFQIPLKNNQRTPAQNTGAFNWTPESNSSQAEVSLQPGVYAVRLQGEFLSEFCSVQLKAHLKPDQLYSAEIEGLLDRCEFEFKRNKPGLGVRPQWTVMSQSELQTMEYGEIRKTRCRMGF